MHADLPLAVKLAFLWNRRAPRGKGAFPRFIGRWLVGGGVDIRTSSGARLRIAPANLDAYAEIHNRGGMWDPHVTAVCARLLRPGDVFYDVGANAGVFAIDFAHRMPDLRVVSFEPQPDQAAAIAASIAANKLDNVTALDCMLGEADGVGALYLTSHSVHASITPREGRSRKIMPVMRSVDSLSREGVAPDPDLVKIDIEGAEMSALRGAAQTFARARPSIVFEADQNLRRVGVAPADLLALIRTFGPCRLFAIDGTGALAPSSDIERPGDYLALAERHEDRLG